MDEWTLLNNPLNLIYTGGYSLTDATQASVIDKMYFYNTTANEWLNFTQPLTNKEDKKAPMMWHQMASYLPDGAHVRMHSANVAYSPYL